MRLKAGVLHLFEQQDGARPCSNSNPRAGQPGGASGEQGWGLLGTRWPSLVRQGWDGCTVPPAPDLRRWEVLLLEGGTWEKAVPPGSLS